jgi:hypothetical protein
MELFRLFVSPSLGQLSGFFWNRDITSGRTLSLCEAPIGKPLQKDPNARPNTGVFL